MAKSDETNMTLPQFHQDRTEELPLRPLIATLGLILLFHVVCKVCTEAVHSVALEQSYFASNFTDPGLRETACKHGKTTETETWAEGSKKGEYNRVLVCSDPLLSASIAES